MDWPDDAKGFIARVNADYLYRSLDGREAWVMFDRAKRLAFIVTDIHQQGPPNNAVGFSAEDLRRIVDELDQMDETPQVG